MKRIRRVGLVCGVMGIILVGANAACAAVTVGNSALIGTVDYSDTFTTTANGGISGRDTWPLGEGGNNVENNYGNPARAWSELIWSIDTDGTVNDPGGVFVGSGAGTDTGMTQTGGNNIDYGIEYGLAEHFVVQFDAFQPPDRIDIGAAITRDTINVSGLHVFFRPNALINPKIGLFNGSNEIDSGLGSGISATNQWHNYAVRFDNVNKYLEVYVDQVSCGVVNLATFNGGSHNTISTVAVNVGGRAFDGARFWSDNFQVGKPVAGLTGSSVVLSTDVMLNRRAPSNAFTNGSTNNMGVAIIRNFNGGQGYPATAVPYTADLAGPTVDLSGYGPILGSQAGGFGADIYGRGGILFAPGDGETAIANSGGIGFGGHAPWIITFDLDLIRASRLGNTDKRLELTGRFGINGQGRTGEAVAGTAVVQGLIYVDGQQAFNSGLKSTATASDTIRKSLGSNARYLTFVIVSGDASTDFDDGAFRDVAVTVTDYPKGTIFLVL